MPHTVTPVSGHVAGTPRILVVDDDPCIRALCTAVLHDEGFEVLEARDGCEGLARAVADRPDLMLCDISMPILDGFGVAVALRQNERTRDLPLVFLSGEIGPGVEARAYAAGARAFIGKPFLAGPLSACIRRLLDQSPGPIGRADGDE